MKKLLFPLLLFLPLSLYSQQDRSPLLHIKNDSAAIALETLSIEIAVVGNIARTTVAMTFYNPQDRVLEGELNFPLGEGQTVSRFAMDVNGKMREGVVVEKAKGRQTFETIVRGNIDPGLLEQTQGNNFKTRVYPIPARGRKSVLIGYEEELPLQEGVPVYHLPMGYGRVSNFSLKAKVLQQELAPRLEPNSTFNFAFEKWEETYLAEFTATNYEANKMLSFRIPRREDSQLYREKTAEGTYFYLNYQPEISTRKKQAPQAVGLLWDVSFSGQKRALEKELALLDAYFRKLGSLTVTLVPFAHEVQPAQQFEVRNGNWSRLKKVLSELPFDGGTRLEALDLTAYPADEYLLFSDGLSTLGAGELAVSGKVLHTINTNQAADHTLLRSLAEANGGSYLNLLKHIPEEGAERLLNRPFQFIRADYQQGLLREVYPSMAQEVSTHFTMSGIANEEEATLTLHFGIGKEVLHSKTFTLDGKSAEVAGYLPKVWAGKKIAELSLRYEKNREEITRLAKEYTIVTPGTSLIVLDRLEDYVRYEIVPPAELQEEYFSLLEEKQEEEKLSEKELLERRLANYGERIAWWETEFPKGLPRRSKKKKGEEGEALLIIEVPDEEEVEEEIELDMEVEEETAVEEVVFEEIPITEQPPPPPAYAPNHINQGDPNEPPADMPTRLRDLAAGVQGNDRRGDMSLGGQNTSSLGASPLYVVDGVPVSQEEFNRRAPEAIASMNVLAGEAAAAIYGSRAQDGALIVVTNEALENNFVMEDSIRAQYEPGIGMKAYSPERPYLDELKKAPREGRYPAYLRLRQEYGNAPSFYLDVANFFIAEGEKEQGIRILSTIADLELENHELLRLLAHRFKQLGEMDYSIYLFKKVLKIREEEPQSYRDLALAYEASGAYQQALELFYKLAKTNWGANGRFPLISTIALYEMNHLIARHAAEINYAHIEKELIHPLPVDVRVVLNWNSADTDMDLWVTDPYGEKCYYQNKQTRIGGRLTADYISGYGPEEFLLKEAIRGTYQVEVNYYGNQRQKISGPVSLQVVIYTHYGSKKEKKEEITLQLEEEKGQVLVGEFRF